MAIPLRILVLEDNPSDAELMLNALRNFGYAPFCVRVESEKEFETQLSLTPLPDVVLADFSMPEFDALRALEILNQFPSDIPLILVSGTIGEERAVEVMKHGAADYIMKDRLTRLGLAVAQALEQKRLRGDKLQAEDALIQSNESSRKEQEARKLAEHERRVLQDSSKQKDVFLAMLGHELRNPLAPIRSAVHVLQEALKGDPRLKKACDIIQRQAQHMTRIVEDLLDLSRISQGKIVLRKEHLDLNELVRQTTDDYRIDVESSGATVKSESSPKPLWIMADPTRICQVVGNLLQNAKKFTRAGDRITVKVSALSEARAELIVRDSGLGMTPETLATVFEPFRQADQSIARTNGGLGLGLSTVKGIVEMHGGCVMASSKGLGLGSEITIQFPLDETVQPVKACPVPALKAKGRRVLIIEDNVDSAEMMCFLLKHEGHDVSIAFTGATGLNAARTLDPEIIVCDIGLPGGMDGYAFARTCRTDPAFQATVLVALTGYGQPSDKKRATDAGFDLHLTKPVDPAALIEVIGSLSVPVA